MQLHQASQLIANSQCTPQYFLVPAAKKETLSQIVVQLYIKLIHDMREVIILVVALSGFATSRRGRQSQKYLTQNTEKTTTVL